ncbi:hypothetical protein [Pseudovibrio exalbescens]|uniref:Uncharacterized protein n=1 Tax=Pseudovibrio exalbescens TaxID=197461 RepID=A0A1U7JJA9_9HYPH|nr:hypothetical protein [Pseudovibrio exalbescens]OKL44741.1 hypothetical protein A3843_06575 [Pseudovibrio exalbescens]
MTRTTRPAATSPDRQQTRQVIRHYYNGLIRIAFLVSSQNIQTPIGMARLRTERDLLLAHPLLQSAAPTSPTLQQLQACSKQAHQLAQSMARNLRPVTFGKLGATALIYSLAPDSGSAATNALQQGLMRRIEPLFAARTLARGLVPPPHGGADQPPPKPTTTPEV